MIQDLAAKYDGKNSTIPDLRFLLTCLLGFARFLRIDELFDVKPEAHKITLDSLRNFNPKIKNGST